MRTGPAVAAALLAAVLVTGAAAAAPAKVWVGTLQLTYVRHYEPETPNGTAVEKDTRSLTITNRRNGTAFASGRIRSSTSFPCSNGASSGRTETWDVRGAVRPLALSFTSTRYQIRYDNPSKRVTIEVRDCAGTRSRTVTERAMDVGFQLYGRWQADATRVSGRWRRAATCTGTCVAHEWVGRWNLRLVTRSG